VQHNLHHFAEAEAIGRASVAARGSPADLAMLSDALVEQGKLGEAIATLQRFVELKPGAEAFTRISHVRWLKGDLAGAVAAMEMAARAADARSAETRAWILVRLSGFCLQAGNVDDARALAGEALGAVAEFAPALLALGRALCASGQFTAAVEKLARATELNPVPEYQWWLADTLREVGRGDTAAEIEAQLKARGAATDPRTLALFLATRGEQPALALRLARQELAQRKDVFTHDAVAWALVSANDLDGAEAAMRAALAENTQDARLSLHAAEISQRQGRLADAATHFARAGAAAATLTPSERARLRRRLDASFQALSPNNHP
jgi:tetratricopeptide (TPR) repeat protein